ncbi:MAG TPA: ABC transporter permease [Capillimicrobium sp.]|nr:ABC transporter permease [Capillimicrobium sp.]
MSTHAAGALDTGAMGAVPPRRLVVRMRGWAASAWPPLIVFVLFIGVWYLISQTVYADEDYLLPSPFSVVSSGWENAGEIWSATKITLTEAAAGFASAIVIGMAAAVLMSQAKWLERSLYPYAVMLQTVPVVAVAPVIVLWFGYNQKSVIVISFMIAVFPIINNTLLGLLSADRNHVDLFRMHKAGRLAQFVKLRLPGALPNIFAGLRVSAGLSVIGAIVGEFIIGSGGSEGGLGVKVIFAQSKLDTDLLFAEVLAATALGFGFFVLVSYLGALLLRSWHESALGADS